MWEQLEGDVPPVLSCTNVCTTLQVTNSMLVTVLQETMDAPNPPAVFEADDKTEEKEVAPNPPEASGQSKELIRAPIRRTSNTRRQVVKVRAFCYEDEFLPPGWLTVRERFQRENPPPEEFTPFRTRYNYAALFTQELERAGILRKDRPQ